MREDGRRILAMGGGGFSTSVADAPLERYIAGLPAVDHPRICLLPTASGDPGRPDRPLPPRVPRPRPALASLALPARHTPHVAARAPARAGRDLRGRRKPGQPARDLARARPRRRAARGVGARNPALRRQRGLHVLVRGRGHPLAWALAPGPGPRAAAGQQLGAPLERPGAASLLPRRRAGRARAPATPWTTEWACCSRARSWWRRSARGPTRAPTAVEERRRRAGGDADRAAPARAVGRGVGTTPRSRSPSSATPAGSARRAPAARGPPDVTRPDRRAYISRA